MKTWLYNQRVKYTLKEAVAGKYGFRLNSLFLSLISNLFHNGKIILRSAELDAHMQRNWERLKKDSRYDMYQPIISKFHFFKDEVWQIKGHFYRVEAVHSLYEIDLVNIETYETTNLEQLMPLAIEDIKYLRSLSYELTKMNIYIKGNYQVMTYEQFAMD